MILSLRLIRDDIAKWVLESPGKDVALSAALLSLPGDLLWLSAGVH